MNVNEKLLNNVSSKDNLMVIKSVCDSYVTTDRKYKTANPLLRNICVIGQTSTWPHPILYVDAWPHLTHMTISVYSLFEPYPNWHLLLSFHSLDLNHSILKRIKYKKLVFKSFNFTKNNVSLIKHNIVVHLLIQM